MNNIIFRARFITLGLAVTFLPFSIRFCHLSLLLFLVVCIAEGNFAQKLRLVAHNPLAWVLPGFFLLHFIGVFYSDNNSNAWANLDKKLAFFLAPLVIASTSPFTKTEIRRLAWIFVAACLAGTIICLVNATITSGGDVPLWNFGPAEPYMALHPDASAKWPYFSYIGLALGIDIHPTYFAFYLLVCVLIIVKTVTNRWLSMSLVIYMLIFIVLLSSRVVVAATIIALVVTAIVNSRERLLAGGVAIMIAVMLINPLALYRNAQEYTRSNFSWPPAAINDNPISIRTSLLWLSIEVMKEVNPVAGSGSGDVNDDMAAMADRHNVHNILNTSDPHNQYLHTFIALGTIGVIMLMAVFLTPLWILFREREFLACAGVVAFMAVCMTESALELQKGIVLFTLFVSLTGNQFGEWRFTTQRLKYA